MASTLRIPTEQDPFADRKRWKADDCRKLEAMGLLEPGTYELIDGEIVEKVGQNWPHSLAGKKTFLALSLVFGADYVQLPVSISITEEERPEPDVFVTLLPDRDYFVRGNPTPADMRLVIEVSDTTLWRDRNTKMRTYAAAGITEYWVLDVNSRKLFVHRTPTAMGYDDIVEYNETQSVAPVTAPDSFINILTLFP